MIINEQGSYRKNTCWCPICRSDPENKDTVKEPIQPVYRQFGVRVAHMRDMLGWSQDEMAGKVGLTRTSIANVEAGKQRILLHDVETFARAFNCSPKQLLRGIWT
jgi:DNA-binding XRE family transcriptional regulator